VTAKTAIRLKSDGRCEVYMHGRKVDETRTIDGARSSIAAMRTKTYGGEGMTRISFWTQFLGVLVAYFVVGIIIGAIGGTSPATDAWLILSYLAVLAVQIHALYFRAVDVGYPNPGWMTAAVFIPLVGSS
jgi:hypothetical protein